jgi:5-bromo-4-chloroindolyl phosphate hydrolysis protein
MDRRNLTDIGDEIKDIVQNAVSTRDFHQLNRDIGNTVNNALDEVKRSIGMNQNDWRNRDNQNWDNRNNQRWDGGNRANHQWDNRSWDRNRDNRNRDSRNWNQNWNQNWNRQAPPPQQQRTSYSTRNAVQRSNNQVSKFSKYAIPVGRVSSILCTVFGSIGIGAFGIAILVLSILANVLGLALFKTIVIGILPLFAGSIFLSSKGGTLRKRVKRFNQYFSLLRNRNYSTIKELSSGSGLSDKFIVKDLRKMIAIGMFPEGHIDEQKTCFMLNNESYDQYLKLQENIRIQHMEELNNKKTESNQNGTEPENQEFRKAIEEGKSYIRQIREANDAIPGEEISQKLYRLESVTGKIFDYVELHPEQLSEIQKFMEYYLPTTSKLLNAYREFENQPVQGENISSAKKEIEGTLDTINLAFENLLDSLFEDAAMDISTDISVLQTMLAQEGLTEKDFSSNKN